MWRAADGAGLEHVRVRKEGGNLVADGAILTIHGDRPMRCNYAVSVDRAGRVRAASVDLPGIGVLRLLGNGEGGWETGLREPLPDLDGCIDIDIALSPFTNAISIRRLGLDKDQEETIPVVHVTIPTLEPIPMRQRYRRIRAGEGLAGRYAYENLSSKVQAEIAVDEDGLVTDYPDAFARIWPA